MPPRAQGQDRGACEEDQKHTDVGEEMEIDEEVEINH
jgi:hypothetical protein